VAAGLGPQLKRNPLGGIERRATSTGNKGSLLPGVFKANSSGDAVPIAATTILFLLLLVPLAQSQIVVLPIATSDAIDLARMIAHDEGYDVRKTNLYTFESADDKGKPFVAGYTTIIFQIDAWPRNLIAINNTTAQAIDFHTCEVFDYPDLKPFQERTMHLNEARRRTTQELAADVGCHSPQLLTKPVPVSKRQ
jgi:hypothetical protein